MSIPDFPLRGLHDGADYMLQHGISGFAVQPVYLTDLQARPVDYSRHAAAGIRVVVRLSYSYARDSAGGQGTFPRADQFEPFAQAAIATIGPSRGVAAWILGNEPNRKAEWPADDQPISTDQVIALYDRIYDVLPLGEKCPVSPPAIDPTNFESGDCLEYFQRIMQGIHGAERFALHAYGYGSTEPVDSNAHFQPPMQWQFHGFRMWQPFAAALYQFSRDGGQTFPYRETPILITESNHLTTHSGQNGWDDDAGSWIQSAYRYVADWDAGPGSQYVHCLALYRYTGDAWALDKHPGLLSVWSESGPVPVVTPPPPSPPPAPPWGPDVSQWQGAIDWHQVKASGPSFTFIKCTEGTSFTDPRFAQNWAGAKGAGLLRGAYHYFHSEYDPAEQAQNFLHALAGDVGELPPVLDVEDVDAAATQVPTATLVQRISAWLVQVQNALGVTPTIYTGAWYWNSRLGVQPWARAYGLWAASYSNAIILPAGFTNWLFWQTSDSGQVPGIGGAVDMNRFNGTMTDLLKLTS